MTEPSEHILFMTQWRLVRSAIEHENTLKSHRVTWFLATQLFLVTGFSSIFTNALTGKDFVSLKVWVVLLVIASMGIYFCMLASVNLNAAQKMITRLHGWWLIHCHDAHKELPEWINSAKYGLGQKDFPPVNGMFTSNRHMIFGEGQLPSALAALWLALLLGASAIVFKERLGVPYLYFIPALFVVGCMAALVYLKGIKTWLDAPSHRKARELAAYAIELKLKHSKKDNLHTEILKILGTPPFNVDPFNSADSAPPTTTPPPASGPEP